MTPSAYYRQHVALEAPRIDAAAFRPFWSVRPRTRLDRLLADGSIRAREWYAAIRFRDAVQNLAGERRRETYERAGGTAPSREVIIYRFDATLLIRRVRAGLGPFATALVWSCAIDDLSWAAVGARLRVDPKTARRWTILALQALAQLEGRASEHERPHNPDQPGFSDRRSHRI